MENNLNIKSKIDESTYIFSNKDLVSLIVPLLIEQLLAFFVGMVDSIMVSSVGEAAVSGVSLVDNIMILLINIFAALATGGAVVAGQLLGQKRNEEASEASTQLVWFILLLSVVITIIVYLFRNPILQGIFGKISPDVMGHANTYLLIVIAAIPFVALYNGGAAIFRTMGNSKIPMQVAIIMNIINVSGNAILVYGFKIGTAGVAIPTLVSRIFSGVTIIILLFNQERIIHIKKSFRYKPNFDIIKRILYIGVPNGL